LNSGVVDVAGLAVPQFEMRQVGRAIEQRRDLRTETKRARRRAWSRPGNPLERLHGPQKHPDEVSGLADHLAVLDVDRLAGYGAEVVGHYAASSASISSRRSDHVRPLV
jgi:hypothetical protein